MLYTLHFFSSKCSLFHNANFFGSCIIHILYTGCAEIKKINSGAKGLKETKEFPSLPDFKLSKLSTLKMSDRYFSSHDVTDKPYRV